MRRLRLYARLARLLAVLALGLALASVVALARRLGRRELAGWRQRLSRWYLARLAAALPFRLEVRGELPRQAMLWVANHVSWSDIPLLGQLFPLTFLSKAEVRTWPVAGWLAQQAGTLFLQRGAGDSVLLQRRMAEGLRQGRAVLLFPEGTTTDGGDLRTFHGRLLGAALEAGVALQPVAISYWRDGRRDQRVAPFIGDDDLVSHLLRLFACDARLEVRIALLAPIASCGLERSELARRAQAAVRAALTERETSEALAAA